MTDFTNFKQASPGESSDVITRRGMMTRVGMAGVAMAATTNPASAFFWGGSVEDVDLNGLPAEWVKQQGDDLTDYAKFLAKLRLKNFTPRQVIEAHAKKRGRIWNTLPPRKLWKNIKPTLKAVDRLAAGLGQSVSDIVSVYRSPAYNALCRGASRRSYHLANNAIDIKFPVRAYRATKAARVLRERGVFRGGVGSYSTFTHLDTRGENVDW